MKNPARMNLRGLKKNETGSTLAELEAFAGTGLTVFFAFLLTGIAGQETFRFQRGAQSSIGFEQGAGNTMTDCAGLPSGAAALDIDADIELASGGGHRERLGDDH